MLLLLYDSFCAANFFGGLPEGGAGSRLLGISQDSCRRRGVGKKRLGGRGLTGKNFPEATVLSTMLLQPNRKMRGRFPGTLVTAGTNAGTESLSRDEKATLELLHMQLQ